MPHLPAEALNLNHPLDAGLLHDVLVKQGYVEERLNQTIVIQKQLWPPRMDRALTERRLVAGEPFSTLFRLFRLEEVCPEAEVREAFAPLDVDELVMLGLLRREGAGLAANLYLGARRGLLVFSDQTSAKADPLYVLGHTQTSEKLEVLTPWRRFERVLDLGTGNGHLAMLAARQSDHVVATDINPRALNLAAFNARLNRLPNIEFRLGSWFEPVAGESFDLILSNPPFIISSGVQSLFRDAGYEADGLMKMLATEMPPRLNPGGLGVYIGNWLVVNNDRVQRLRPWLEDAGVDVIVLHGMAQSAEEYARHWLCSAHAQEDDAFRQELTAWLDYYRQQGIEQIVNGGVIMRRHPGPNTFLAFEVREQEKGEYGDQLEFIFAQSDFLRRHADPAALLRARLRLADGHSMEQVLHRVDGEYRLHRCTLRHLRGMTLPEALDERTLPFLQLFDGKKNLGTVLAELAAQFGAPPEAIRDQGLILAQRFILRGYLVSMEGT
jgi:methylase of polypeptide subunit release factors